MFQNEQLENMKMTGISAAASVQKANVSAILTINSCNVISAPVSPSKCSLFIFTQHQKHKKNDHTGLTFLLFQFHF